MEAGGAACKTNAFQNADLGLSGWSIPWIELVDLNQFDSARCPEKIQKSRKMVPRRAPKGFRLPIRTESIFRFDLSILGSWTWGFESIGDRELAFLPDLWRHSLIDAFGAHQVRAMPDASPYDFWALCRDLPLSLHTPPTPNAECRKAPLRSL